MPKDLNEKDRPWTVEEVDDLEQSIERLRALYDLYFQGIERLEPIQARKNVFRRVIKINPAAVANTGLRFRLRNLIQRFSVYQAYWNRIAMQIEAGTYTRERLRGARRRDQEEQKPGARRPRRGRGQPRAVEDEAASPPIASTEPSRGGAATSSAASATSAASAASATPTRPAPAAVASPVATVTTTAPAPAAPPVRSTPAAVVDRSSQYRSVYDELIRRRQECQQGTEGMSFDLIAQRLDATRASLMASSGCQDVQFRVIVEGGKAKLKGVPRS